MATTEQLAETTRAIENATTILRAGVKAIDAEFSPGYAEENPMVVAAWMLSATEVVNSSAVALAIAALAGRK